MIFVLAFLFLLFAGPVEAVTRYVDPICPNAIAIYNPTAAGPARCAGGSATVYTTFDNGVAATSAGDTLLIRAGTYNTYLDTRPGQKNAGAASGTAGNPITIAAYPGNCYTAGTIGPGGGCESVTFRPTVALNDAVLMMTVQYWTFDGLRINAAAAYQGAKPASNNTFKNMDVFGMNLDNNRPTEAGQGFFIAYNTTGVLIDNTKIHDATTNLSPFGVGAMGLYWQGSNSTLQNSEVYNLGGYGMQLFCNLKDDVCTGAQSNNTVKNNKIHDIGTTGLAIEARSQPGATSHKIYNNIVYNNGNRGIGVRSEGGAGHLVYSNTIYGNATAGISLSNGTAHIIRNNIVWGNDTSKSGLGDFYDDGVGGSATATNNLCGSVSGSGFGSSSTVCPYTTNPLFVNPGTGDFHIQADSPAIDHGFTLSAPYDTDFAGNTRFAPFDIGAYEFGVAQVVTITGPTSADTLTTSSNTVNVTGTSNLSSGSITWSCDRCTPATGTATGLASWTIPTLTLKAGVNILTVTGGSGTDVLTVTYAPSFPGNSLVAAWGFDAGSGSAAIDSSGNTNTGSLVNTPLWVAGKFGSSSLLFNGTNQYIQVSDSNALDLTQSFTISAWVNPVTIHTDFRAVLGKASNIYYLYASVAGLCGSGGQIGFFNTNGPATGPDFSVCDSNPLPIGVWTHLAATYDNATATLRLYKNGIEVSGSPLTASGYMEPSTGDLRIAGSEYGEFFEGALDEIRIYNWAIPRTQTPNTSPGATCGYANQADRTNMTKVSIVGDMNCGVIHPVAVSPIAKFPAAAGAFKFSGNFKIGH